MSELTARPTNVRKIVINTIAVVLFLLVMAAILFPVFAQVKNGHGRYP